MHLSLTLAPQRLRGEDLGDQVLPRVQHLQGRQAPVNYIDETSWFLTNTLQWLWVMASDTVAFYMLHSHRPKAAFAALIDGWEGLLTGMRCTAA